MALDQYLKKFITKDKSSANYIKIGDAELNVFGNKYQIIKDNLNEFQENYKENIHEYIFIPGPTSSPNMEYMSGKIYILPKYVSRFGMGLNCLSGAAFSSGP